MISSRITDSNAQKVKSYNDIHMLDQKTLSTWDYQDSESSKKWLTYKEWVKSLREEFKKWIELHKNYTTIEKHEMVKRFIWKNVQYFLRKYIGQEGNYSFYMKEIENTLLWCFKTVLEARKRTEERIYKIMQLQDCIDHVATHSHFYKAEGIE